MVHARDVPVSDRRELLPVSAADFRRNPFHITCSIGVIRTSADMVIT